MQRLLTVALVCLLVAVAASADEFRDYPEFRYASGLPGGSHGVTPDGHVGFDGAMQLNTPVGYTPGWGNFMLTASAAAINGGFPTDFSGTDNNGTVTVGFGMFNEHRLWFSEMGTGKGDNSLEPVENLQFEIVPETEDRPAIAIGVVDILDRRAATLDRPLEGAGRSFYIVGTREGGTPDKPLYYTLGYGNGRFHCRPFGGISYQPASRAKLFAEYDGWVGNVGGAYDVLSSEEWHGIFGISLVDFERLDLTFAITKTSF